MSKNRKNGVKKFFVIIFERFDILKMLNYIRQMRDEIKCNKAHYFFNEILRYNLIKMAAEICRGNFENFRKK